MISKVLSPIGLVLFLFGCSAAAPTGDAQLQIIKAEAEKVAKALKDGDYATLTKLTHPSLVEKLGGKDKMVEIVKNGMETMKAQGLAFSSYTVEAPKEVVASGNELFAIAPQTLTMTTPGKKVTLQSFLVGISSDKGKTWTFLDGSKIDEKQVKELVPSWPDNLKLPAKQQPKVEKAP